MSETDRTAQGGVPARALAVVYWDYRCLTVPASCEDFTVNEIVSFPYPEGVEPDPTVTLQDYGDCTGATFELIGLWVQSRAG